MSVVKCPNCGSIDQLEMVWEDRDSYSTKKTKEYVCGCGCYFEAIFTLTETKILEKNKKGLTF